MLYIDDTRQEIRDALQIHERLMLCYVKRRLYGETSKCNRNNCEICSSKIEKATIDPYLGKILKKLDLQMIIAGRPDELFAVQDYFLLLYLEKRKTLHKDFITDVSKIFNYEWFGKKNDIYSAYELCGNLGLETCVYCNRLYISTIVISKKDKIIRPSLDHWFSQELYPLLAISFYNLIPSCSSCNSSIKHVNKLELDLHIHPYVDKDITKQYSFKLTYKTGINKFSVELETANSKIVDTLSLMRLCEVYQHHQSELNDLDIIKRKYRPAYLRGIKGMLNNSTLSEKDVYRILFGTEYDDQDFINRPLSKLKKDLLDP